MVATDQYLALREQAPTARIAMYHRWRDLLFLHFATDPAEIQKLLPAGLTVDTFPDESGEEKAWIGLVAFYMEGVRLRGVPAIPGTSAFPETNVRTYVHREGKEPGVWFFSLDAANRFACAYARRFFSLPYYWAAMSVNNDGTRRDYESNRVLDPEHTVNASCAIGENLPHPQPGSLEFFLVERYLLYALHGERLYKGMVAHAPYPVRNVTQFSCETTLIEANGIQPREWSHAIFSPGVDVRVHAIERV
jgi:uncharacterized protein YqjF (DUF2071 family)